VSEHTTVKLAKALGEIPGVPKDMIQRAIDGYYHDYLSPLDMPEMQLISDLKAVAKTPATPRNSRPLLLAMAQRVVDGEFDANREEAEAWMQSTEGQDTMRQLADDAVFGGIVRDIQERP
jgi:hypothetical protein